MAIFMDKQAMKLFVIDQTVTSKGQNYGPILIILIGFITGPKALCSINRKILLAKL